LSCYVPLNLSATTIVALGGDFSPDDDDVPTQYFDSAEMFTLATSTWAGLPSMTTTRGNSPAVCAAVNKTKLIACGGSTNGVILNSCEMLDLTNKTAGWTLISNMTLERIYTSGTLLSDDNTYLMIGGSSDFGGGSSSACEKLDIYIS
jgi:hypothetical protein